MPSGMIKRLHLLHLQALPRGELPALLQAEGELGFSSATFTWLCFSGAFGTSQVVSETGTKNSRGKEIKAIGDSKGGW